MNVELQEYLKQQRDLGYKWIVYDTDNPIRTKYELQFFKEQQEAFDSAKQYQQIFNWHEAVPIDELLSNLARLEKITLKAVKNKTDIIINRKDMNLNNLENLKRK